MFECVIANILCKGSTGLRVTCKSTLLDLWICPVFSHRQQEFARTLLVPIFLISGKRLFHYPTLWKTFLIEFWRRSWQVIFIQMEVVCRVEFKTAKVPGAHQPLTSVSARREKTSKNALQRELWGGKYAQHCRQMCLTRSRCFEVWKLD